MTNIDSKLPHVGTTIFTVMTQLAQELRAINLAQGFPDYDPPELLKELLRHHAAHGDHQYAPMPGVLWLKEQIAAHYLARHAVSIDPVNELTITLGATEGIFSSIQAVVRAGDEVVLIDPSYDSYAPSVLLAGGTPVRVPLTPPHFHFDWERIAAHVNAKTRLIIVNSPHNPTGNLFSKDDVRQLETVVLGSRAFVLSDEVYEHITFDGRRHISLAARPALRERALSVFSFGKPLHATGWRVGYVVAAAPLTRELRRVHQFNTFTIATSLQLALADFMLQAPTHFDDLAAYYQRKRDRFIAALSGAPVRIAPAAGTYFQTVDFAPVTDLQDSALADRIIREAGVASIPVSPFYEQAPRTQVIRFCFAKRDETLDAAAVRLREWIARL